MAYRFIDEKPTTYRFVGQTDLKEKDPSEYDPSSPEYKAKYGAEPPPAYAQIAGALARTGAQGLAGIPLAALEAGAGLLNLATGGDLSPARQWNEGLNSLIPAPDTWQGQLSEFAGAGLVGSRLPVPTVAKQTPANYRPAAQAAREAAFKEGQKQGYVVPPSVIKPTAMNRSLEGIAGKTRVGQEAALKNQAVTDTLAQRGVGSNAPLAQGSLETIRREAVTRGYEPVRSAGEVIPGPEYFKALDDVVASSKGASRSFGDAAEPNEAAPLIEKLKKITKFDAGDAVDQIALLREKADAAYSAGNRAAGKAYKAAATAIENSIEAHLGKSGGDALKNFREARQLIAKTHTAAKALVGDGGQSKASAYASRFAAQRPLTGEQRAIGKFASTFPKYTPNPRGDNFPVGSPIDVYGAGAVAALTESVAPLAYPLARFGLGKYLLSPQYQQGLLAPAVQQAPQNMGMAGAFAGWPSLLGQ